MAALTPTIDTGCPSGFAPPAEAASAPRPDPAAFVRRDASGLCHLDLLVRGAKCAGCIAKIEGGVGALPSVRAARLNLTTGRLTVSWTAGGVEPRRIVETLDRLGYDSAPFDPQAAQIEDDALGRDLLRRMAVAGFAAMNVMMFSVPVWSGHGEMGESTRTTFHWISALVAAPASLYAAVPFFKSGWRALRAGHANMDVPISLAVVLTLGVSLMETALGGRHAYFDGAAMFLFLLLIGRALDHALRRRAGRAAKDLLALQAVAATRLNANGGTQAVAAREVRPGDLLLLAAGERAAVDCVVESGASEVDRALVTGESAPVAVQPGAAVAAGTVNLTRALTVRATATADASTVAELARLIEAGAQSKARFMRLADAAARLYVPLVHSAAFATLIGWLWLGGADLRVALLNAAAVLIITCPCALGLAAPAVQIVATGRLFRRGVLVRSGDALERLAKVSVVAFDKTGTLTLGRPRLVGDPGPALATAAELARVSRHPLAQAVAAAAGPGAPARQSTETPGFGVEGVLGDGRSARLGRRAFVDAIAVDAPREAAGVGSELWFAAAGSPPVRFQFEDALREDAAETVAALKARGIAVTLLSGDLPEAAEAAARAAGVDTWLAELTPSEKVAQIHALKAGGRTVLMVGDGLNDAAALAAADASASPGSAMDITQAAADLVIQGPRLAPIVEAIDVARAARRRTLESFGFAAVYNVAAMPLAAAGLLTPFIAALAMSLSSIVVTLNAMRLSGPDGFKAPLAGGRRAWTR